MEICTINGTWGTVCDFHFNCEEASVACHQLGFQNACKWIGKQRIKVDLQLELTALVLFILQILFEELYSSNCLETKFLCHYEHYEHYKQKAATNNWPFLSL